VAASVGTCHLLIWTYLPPTAEGVALDVIERWLAQLFYHTNTGGFLLWTLEIGKCDTSPSPVVPRASSTTIRDREERQIQPKETRKR
jgi:hypothetical protein